MGHPPDRALKLLKAARHNGARGSQRCVLGLQEGWWLGVVVGEWVVVVWGGDSGWAEEVKGCPGDGVMQAGARPGACKRSKPGV